MTPLYQFVGMPGAQEAQPWGKALSYSTVLHSVLFFLLFTLAVARKPALQTVLTEVNFLEQPAPEPMALPAPAPASGGHEGGGAQLGEPGTAVPAAGHPELQNVVPYSSAQGSPSGDVVANVPMSGPIIQSGDIGLIGRKKGALIALAGRTEGPATPLLPKGALGGSSSGKDKPIALAVEDIGAIRKKDTGLGAPLIRGGVAGTGGDENIKKLAGLELGKSRDLKYEKLRANPNDDDKFGNNKGPFSIEGPLKYRKILKRVMPPYPRWAEEQGIEPSVSLRLWVGPDGRVKDSIYIEKGSGYPELDQLATEAMKQFRFVPLPDGAAPEDEWGVATFRFELKK